METVAHITSAAHGGYGVCRLDGQVCFTPYALPGDVVRLRVARQTKGVLWGELIEVEEPSSDRQEVPCPHFGQCGGCTWLHFAYPAQAEWKRRIVQDCLERLGGLHIDVRWAEDASLRIGYRTRAEFQVARGRVGFFERASHNVVPVAACPLCHPRLNSVIEPLAAARPHSSVEVTVNPEGDEVLIHQPGTRSGVVERRVADAFPNATGSRRFLFDGVPIANAAFSQSSLLLNRVLRDVVQDLLGEPSSLLDLYCGSGNFSLPFQAAEVVGLDHNATAVSAAQEAADAQGRHARYESVAEFGFRNALSRTWDAIILDPPRAGARPLIPHLLTAQANALVYVSCDPATLARDLRALAAGPWRLTDAVAVDMFPNTAHVETVCRLERTS